MPLKILTCTCGNSSNLARRTLKEAKNVPWLTVPIVRGKKEVAKEIESLPEFVRNSPQCKALTAMLTHKSKFVVFLGYSSATEAVIWADVAGSSTKDRLDAQLIAEKYYNEA